MKMRTCISAGLLGLCLLLLAGCKGGSGKEEKQPEVEEILKAVQEAYGENYLPDTDLDETALSQMMGMDLDSVESFAGQMPMIGAHPDWVIIAKAKEGRGDDLEAELTKMRTALVEDTLVYPMNIAKVQASQVVRHGDYVALLLVGAVDERLDISEEEALAFAKEETQKAVDAFEGCF